MERRKSNPQPTFRTRTEDSPRAQAGKTKEFLAKNVDDPLVKDLKKGGNAAVVAYRYPNASLEFRADIVRRLDDEDEVVQHLKAKKEKNKK